MSLLETLGNALSQLYWKWRTRGRYQRMNCRGAKAGFAGAGGNSPTTTLTQHQAFFIQSSPLGTPFCRQETEGQRTWINCHIRSPVTEPNAYGSKDPYIPLLSLFSDRQEGASPPGDLGVWLTPGSWTYCAACLQWRVNVTGHGRPVKGLG